MASWDRGVKKERGPSTGEERSKARGMASGEGGRAQSPFNSVGTLTATNAERRLHEHPMATDPLSLYSVEVHPSVLHPSLASSQYRHSMVSSHGGVRAWCRRTTSNAEGWPMQLVRKSASSLIGMLMSTGG